MLKGGLEIIINFYKKNFEFTENISNLKNISNKPKYYLNISKRIKLPQINGQNGKEINSELYLKSNKYSTFIWINTI